MLKILIYDLLQLSSILPLSQGIFFFPLQCVTNPTDLMRKLEKPIDYCVN